MKAPLSSNIQQKEQCNDDLHEEVNNRPVDTFPLLKVFQSLKQKVQSRVDAVRAWKLSVWAQQYNPSQWCYFVAGILLFLAITGEKGNSYSILAGWVAFFGLSRELLHLFQRIWDTTLGKGAILILYASTANIALAYAAMKINLISGVEPTPFVFTLGFTTLVLMPFWITLSTVLVFLVFLILANLWLLVRLPLKLVGFDIQLHWEDKKRAVLTMFLRIVLIPLALISILEAATPYFADFMDGVPTAKQIRLEIEEGFGDATDLSDEQPAAPVTEELDGNKERQPVTSSEQVSTEQDAPETSAEFTEEQAETKRKGMVINRLIANFMWYFEAYPNSFCEKPEEVRTVPIEEGVVLFVYQDESQEIGYRYDVSQCILRKAARVTSE